MELDLMEVDVLEIAPLASSRSPNRLKRKEIILHEVDDAEEGEDSADIMVIDKKLDSRNKGKTVISNGYFDHQAKVPYGRNPLGPGGVDTLGTSNSVEYSKSFAPDSPYSINLDSHGSDNYQDDDRYIDFYTNDVDEYEFLQAQFDKVDIPPGVEAALPWLPDLSQIKSKAPVSSGSNYRSPVQSGHGFPLHGVDPFPSIWSSKATQFGMNTGINPPGAELSAPQFCPQAVHGENKSVASKPSWSALKNRLSSRSLQLLKSKHSSSSSQNQLHSMKPPHGFEPSSQEHYFPTYIKAKGGSNMGYSNFPSQMGVLNHQHGADLKQKVRSHTGYSNFPSQMGMLNHQHGADAFSWSQAFQKSTKGSFVPSFSPSYTGVHDPFDDLPLFSEEVTDNFWGQEFAGNKKTIAEPEAGCSTTPFDSKSTNGSDRNLEDILMKFRHFKQFDTVDDHSDHHYVQKGYSTKQASVAWAKRIQEEWKILDKDLPDTIFVRVYESRMDLLRAVIKGAEGTPYHDGLFFFDVFFPSGYPSVPPNVYYHSGGLRLNPNLYHYGKVCLSLLNTWPGDPNESWIPGTSSMLQVLVSIQGLILNTKPYFNEPGLARLDGTPHGEKASLKYNEDTFILSLRTMSFTMRRPPKHFEDLVIGHFCERAQDVMIACKAYMNGAQVGSLVKGRVQDVDEGNKSYNSRSLKVKLAQYAPVLAKDLMNIGAKDCEEFIAPPSIPPKTPTNPGCVTAT